AACSAAAVEQRVRKSPRSQRVDASLKQQLSGRDRRERALRTARGRQRTGTPSQATAQRRGTPSTSDGSAVLDLEPERPEPLCNAAVELGLVLLGRVVVEGLPEGPADVGEDLGTGLDRVHVVAGELFRAVTVATVVGVESLLRLGD